MKIRLSGTMEEIQEMVAALAASVHIREASSFYLNRGSTEIGRVYLDCVPRPTVVQAEAQRTDQTKPARRSRRRNPELPGKPD